MCATLRTLLVLAVGFALASPLPRAPPLRCLRSETSRFSFEVSSARSAIKISRSALNGFSMKS